MSSHFPYPPQPLNVTSRVVCCAKAILDENCTKDLLTKSQSMNGLSILVTVIWSGTCPGPQRCLEGRVYLFSITYHLSFNHVQDDREVGVDDLLAGGRHVRLRQPVAGPLQVHEDLLLERTEARVGPGWTSSPQTGRKREALHNSRNVKARNSGPRGRGPGRGLVWSRGPARSVRQKADANKDPLTCGLTGTGNSEQKSPKMDLKVNGM